MQVVFRTDASKFIGHGHIMRCLTLANALREQGVGARFICREHEGHLCDHIQKQGFLVDRLPEGIPVERTVENADPAGWLGVSWQDDARQTEAIIEAMGVELDWLIVDHYAIDFNWEYRTRPSAKRVMVIDDLANRRHDCDLLLDQNFVAGMANRYDEWLPDTCGRLLGPEYALLQPIYKELHTQVSVRKKPIKRILISFGGVDNNNLSGRCVAELLALGRADIHVDIVVGGGSSTALAVEKQIAGHVNFQLHHDLPTLAPLMVKADLAIGACGASSWERICLGLPAIVITLADNQRAIAECVQKHGLAHYLGHHDQVSQSVFKEALIKFIEHGNLEEWSSHCADLIDGNGTDRVCAALTISAETTLKVRRATSKDEARLLEWVNDPTNRRAAFSSEPIEREEHSNWFRERLRDIADCRLFIGETMSGVPCGQVRFEKSEKGWEVHYVLASAFRGRGLGRQLLETALAKLRQDIPDATVYGYVKVDNVPSRKIFDALDFEILEISENNMVTFWRQG